MVVFENTSYNQAVRQPAFGDLAKKGVLFTNFHAETHPSQPNYIAMVSGSTYGVTNNRSVTLDVPHIGDLLELKGRDWRAYVDQYPGNCYLGDKFGGYTRKHLPFISFQNVQEDKVRCAKIVNSEKFDDDIENGNLADYSLYIPDNKNNGHDTGVAFAGTWFSSRFKSLIEDPIKMKDLLFIVTFDEGTWLGNNQIFTAFYGGSVRPGTQVSTRHDHYSLLRLLEEEWDLGSLNQNDAEASLIEGIWN